MIKSQAKRFELNFLLKLSDLKSNFTLTLGYLNPALNNPGQDSTENCLQMVVATHSSLGREEALLRKLTYS